ncbi:MAG: hypothetical protein J0L93_08935 [Deltaproteobacteria bacterium]|nr:hypothetical protein [Deltaproteobacteria bacterium]
MKIKFFIFIFAFGIFSNAGAFANVECLKILSDISSDAKESLSPFGEKVFEFWHSVTKLKLDKPDLQPSQLGAQALLIDKSSYDWILGRLEKELSQKINDLNRMEKLNVQEKDWRHVKKLLEHLSEWSEFAGLAKIKRDAQGILNELKFRAARPTYEDLWIATQVWLKFRGYYFIDPVAIVNARAQGKPVRSSISQEFAERRRFAKEFHEILLLLKGQLHKPASFQIFDELKPILNPNAVDLPTHFSLSIEEINSLSFLPVYLLGLVDRPTAADSRFLDSNNFFIHDQGHATFLKRSNYHDFSGNIDSSIQSVLRRLTFWKKLKNKISQFSPTEQKAIQYWIFEITHETNGSNSSDAMNFSREGFLNRLSSLDPSALNWRLSPLDFGTDVSTEVSIQAHAQLKEILTALKDDSK